MASHQSISGAPCGSRRPPVAYRLPIELVLLDALTRDLGAVLEQCKLWMPSHLPWICFVASFALRYWPAIIGYPDCTVDQRDKAPQRGFWARPAAIANSLPVHLALLATCWALGDRIGHGNPWHRELLWRRLLRSEGSGRKACCKGSGTRWCHSIYRISSVFSEWFSPCTYFSALRLIRLRP